MLVNRLWITFEAIKKEEFKQPTHSYLIRHILNAVIPQIKKATIASGARQIITTKNIGRQIKTEIFGKLYNLLLFMSS